MIIDMFDSVDSYCTVLYSIVGVIFERLRSEQVRCHWLAVTGGWWLVWVDTEIISLNVTPS